MIDDIDLAAAVSATLAPRHAGVTIAVTNGVVTLGGEVASARQGQDAEALVRRFGGVSDVINTITVK